MANSYIENQWKNIIKYVDYNHLTTSELKSISLLENKTSKEIHTYYMSLSILVFFSREVLAGLIPIEDSSTQSIQLWTLIANFDEDDIKHSLMMMARQFIRWGRKHGYGYIWGYCLDGVAVMERLRHSPKDNSGYFEWRYDLQGRRD
jgi:hypothetical protein